MSTGAYVYGAIDNTVLARWMRIPDTKVAWGPVMDGYRVPLLGETLEMNPWANGICAVAPDRQQPPGWIDYDGR